MQIETKISIIEAILFACGEPVEADRLAEASGIEPELIPRMIRLLNDRYEKCESSLRTVKLNDSYQLTAVPLYADYVKSALENRKTAVLSQAAIEVLTIVAYNQPVTKSFVEHIRGVDSSGTVNSLVEKNLLQEAGRLDVPGRPIAYETTENFLRCFQISSLDDLPPLPSHNEQVSFDEIENQKSPETEDI